MIRIISILLFLFGAFPAFAYHPEDGIDLNAVVTNFDFAEYDDMRADKDKRKVVTEKGWIYGGDLEFKTTFNRIYVQANAGLHQGNVAYDGEAQGSGAKHKTRTLETIADYSFGIGRAYETWRRHDYSFIYAGVGFHQWVRDIESKDEVLGLYELYRWWYAHVGARGYLFRMGPVHVFGEISILRTLVPEMTISFRQDNVDNVKLNLGEHYSAKFTLPIRILLGRHFQMNLEPFWEAWDLGRSGHMDLTTQGVVVGGVHEPRSTSRMWGMNIGFSMRFD
ncbi:MAG: hypothetical protein OEZ43_13825 [Gammaproteobacteria bacterium]|nr:hypothetical protein [Gammaproteobacteria bacterium]